MTKPRPFQSRYAEEDRGYETPALNEAADYGGHGVSQGGANPTGSSITNPEGERTGHEGRSVRRAARSSDHRGLGQGTRPAGVRRQGRHRPIALRLPLNGSRFRTVQAKE
jgi:hypothetical protein